MFKLKKEGIMSEKACHAIREVKKYVDPEGREVLEFVQVFGKATEPNLVKGAVMLMIGGGMNMPPRQMRLEWAFPEGISVKKAFETFDAAATAEVEMFKKQQQEQAKANSVVGAGAGAMSMLLGPNGKPMKAR